MEHRIVFRFGDGREYGFDVPDAGAIRWEQAQKWIDEEYLKANRNAEALVGTASLAEKILSIATACGPQPFADNTAWALQFARCTGRTTGRQSVTVSVGDQVVSL